jgi:peptidoglycan/xylan/chitin deacetylase (PgdA/CDA1 family)
VAPTPPIITQPVAAPLGVRRRVGWGLLWLIGCVGLTLAYWHAVRPDLRYWPGMRTHGDPARNAVALTFDDGPHPLWTPLLADTLTRAGAKGTFFLVGVEAQKYPELVARLRRAGHEVASHSHTHPYPNLTAYPPDRIAAEIRQSRALLAQLTRDAVPLFRPPGGGVNDAVLAALRDEGMTLAWWSANCADAASPPPAETVARLRAGLRPGAILLLHARGATCAALAHYLATPEARRYTFESFSAVQTP